MEILFGARERARDSRNKRDNKNKYKTYRNVLYFKVSGKDCSKFRIITNLVKLMGKSKFL